MYNDYSSLEDTVTDAKAINQSLRNIALTRIGSLPGKPEFGSNILDVVFDPMDHIIEDAVISSLTHAIYKYEPRITIDEITVKEVPEYNRVTVSVTYEFTEKGVLNNATTNIAINKG